MAGVGVAFFLGFTGLAMYWVVRNLYTVRGGGGGTSGEVPGMGVNMDRMGRISVRREGCQLLLKRMCSERSER